MLPLDDARAAQVATRARQAVETRAAGPVDGECGIERIHVAGQAVTRSPDACSVAHAVARCDVERIAHPVAGAGAGVAIAVTNARLVYRTGSALAAAERTRIEDAV